jgi:hypothetical protein
MSIYKIDTLDPNIACHVGFDSSLDTYFLYVANTLQCDLQHKPVGGHNGHVILWAGIDANEIIDIHKLVALANPYAILNDEMKARLEADRYNDRNRQIASQAA